MRVHRLLAVLVLTSFLLIWYYILRVNNGLFSGLSLGVNSTFRGFSLGRKSSNRLLVNGTEIAIVVVACGERHNEALNMIKSALMFNRNQAALKFVVVAEEKLKQNFVEKLDDWQEINENIFTYEIHSLTFPEANKDEWKKLFKPCAAQRLFLPSLLPHIDSVLYVDSDTIFLSPVQELWSLFPSFSRYSL